MNSAGSRRHDRLNWVLVAVGLGLRCWQFVGNAALHIDELALARNIVERTYGELLRPLDYGQVAPAGFLLLEKSVWSIFHTDWSLRLLPFLGAVASVFLFRALARRVLTGIAVPLALALFAVGVPLILYGAEVKQYSSGVAIGLGLLVLAVGLVRDAVSGRRCLVAGLAGFVAVWFSSTAVLLLTGVGTALGLLLLRGRLGNPRGVALLVLLPWGLGVTGAALLDTRLVAPETMLLMKDFWRSGFPPTHLLSVRDLTWPWRALEGLFGKPGGLRYRLPSGYVVLSLLGVAALWRRERGATLVLLGPVAVTLAAATARLYPFADRLVLFLTPVLLLAVGAGGAQVAEWLRPLNSAAAPALVWLILAAPLERIGLTHPVYRIQQSRALFEWLSARLQPGDVEFVWFRAAPHFSWYGSRYHLTGGEVVTGGCWLSFPRGFLLDLDPLRGKPRVWLIFAGADSPESDLALRYADSIGVRREGRRFLPTFPGYLPMAAWLYDFSDSTRLARASAESFPVQPRVSRAWSLISCHIGPVTAGEPR